MQCALCKCTLLVPLMSAQWLVHWAILIIQKDPSLCFHNFLFLSHVSIFSPDVSVVLYF